MSENKFDPANYPDGVPATLYSGDRWAFTLSDLSADYSPDDYTLTWILVRQDAAGATHEFVADDPTGDGVFVIEVSGVDPSPGTTPWTGEVEPDEYLWKIKIARDVDDEDVTVDQGYLTVRPSLDAAGDVRPHNLIVLQNIRAVIEGTATKEQASYSVAGRSLARRQLSELLELEEEYSQRWERDKARLDRESGRPANSRKTLIRLDA